MNDRRQERPWAVPKRKGFTGYAPGLYFWYYATRDQAEQARSSLVLKGKFTGPVEHRPGECYALGWI